MKPKKICKVLSASYMKLCECEAILRLVDYSEGKEGEEHAFSAAHAVADIVSTVASNLSVLDDKIGHDFRQMELPASTDEGEGESG